MSAIGNTPPPRFSLFDQKTLDLEADAINQGVKAKRPNLNRSEPVSVGAAKKAGAYAGNNEYAQTITPEVQLGANKARAVLSVSFPPKLPLRVGVRSPIGSNGQLAVSFTSDSKSLLQVSSSVKLSNTVELKVDSQAGTGPKAENKVGLGISINF
jgi:hypothetical protein